MQVHMSKSISYCVGQPAFYFYGVLLIPKYTSNFVQYHKCRKRVVRRQQSSPVGRRSEVKVTVVEILVFMQRSGQMAFMC